MLARDCVASIRRWGAKDTFGQALLSRRRMNFRPLDDKTDPVSAEAAVSAVAGRAREIAGVYMPAMMPERLALTDPATQVTEMVGSGPFRFKADERLAGARAVYERFAGYVPVPNRNAGSDVGSKGRASRPGGMDDRVGSPRRLRQRCKKNETDWWDYASADLLPLLRRNAGIRVEVQDPAGQIALLRMNHLQPPFNNPAVAASRAGGL